jgi:hypothetical protein
MENYSSFAALELQRQDHSPPAESNTTFKLNSQSQIPQNPRKIRKKKKTEFFNLNLSFDSEISLTFDIYL